MAKAPHPPLGPSVAALLGALLLVPAAAWAKPSPFMPMLQPMRPPAGFLNYCLREPADCGVDPATPEVRKAVSERYWNAVFIAAGRRPDTEPPARITPADLVVWNDEMRRKVDAINRGVNRSIIQRRDPKGSEEDYWGLPSANGKDRFGDCEDYVLEKRRLLIRMGVAPAALSIAVGRTRQGEDHALLLLATERGDMVLDNRNEWVVPWSKAGYVWLGRQAPGAPFRWLSSTIVRGSKR